MSDKIKPKRKASRAGLKFIAIAELIVIVILGGTLIWQGLLKDKLTGGDAVETLAQSGEPQVRTRAVIEKEESFYQLDGRKILFNDSTYGEIFMPVFADVPASELNTDSIVTRNGYSFYKENDTITSFAGVDVSQYQGDIDWEQVKAAGIDFAMIRVGYRSYGGGEIHFDESFAKNLQGANDACIKTGVYFFSQAVTTDEAIEEADAVIDAIAPYNITYPVVYDWELIYEDSARTDSISVEMLADCCISFCERVKSAGYTPMIYQNKNTSMYKLDLPRLTAYDFWLAEYDEKPSYYYRFQMWQYASDGTIPGISGEVDMNLSFKDYSQQTQ